jgi:ATP-dependent Clp protease ATP-binding subunit ClpC
MLEKLSPVSLKCFDAAKQQAHQLKSAELSADHLFLALLEQQDGWLGDLIEPYHVSVAQVAEAVRASQQRVGGLAEGDGAAPGRLVVAADLKAVLKQSIALAQGVPVMPVHLLRALLDTVEALCETLERTGVRVADVRERLAGQQADSIRQQAVVAEPPAQQAGQVAQGDGSRAAIEPEVAGKTAPAVEHKPTPTLDRYGRDLTRLAQEGQLHAIIGREREISAMIEILCRTMKRNPILVGEPGVGKTALAEGLAQRIVADQVPVLLQGKRLVELSISSLVAGASQVGEFEKRMQRLVSEVQSAGDVVLFIDEAHALMGAGGMYGLQDAATILKPALARGDIVCIGSTTTSEYRRYIEKDGALARRFQAVRVEEPGQPEVLGILKTLKPRFEAHFEVEIPDSLLDSVYELSKNYLKNRYFPDKAIDLLERTASRAMLVAEPERKLSLDTMLSVLSDMTGIPLTKLDQGEMERYLRMEEILKERVIGQELAVDTVASLIRLTKRRLDLDPRRPDGVFLFVGPAGVGKTELAKALTEFLFGDQDRLIRLDMSEFSSEFTVSRLIGSPPGYVGYDQGGQLTERVHAQPFCVLLLDEIEKAHPAVLNLFLQVFDDGHLTDAQGRTVHFSDTTIIMTSNLASELWFRRKMGFGEGDRQIYVTEEAVMDVLRRQLPGEFLSRIDEVAIFNPLTDDAVLQIARLKMHEIVRSRFARQNVEIVFEPEVTRYVAGKGYDPRLGCRRLERVIQKEVLEPLAEQMYRADWQGVRSVKVAIVDGGVVFERRSV